MFDILVYVRRQRAASTVNSQCARLAVKVGNNHYADKA
jgi:hypothetical protein